MCWPCSCCICVGHDGLQEAHDVLAPGCASLDGGSCCFYLGGGACVREVGCVLACVVCRRCARPQPFSLERFVSPPPVAVSLLVVLSHVFCARPAALCLPALAWSSRRIASCAADLVPAASASALPSQQPQQTCFWADLLCRLSLTACVFHFLLLIAVCKLGLTACMFHVSLFLTVKGSPVLLFSRAPVWLLYFITHLCVFAVERAPAQFWRYTRLVSVPVSRTWCSVLFNRRVCSGSVLGGHVCESVSAWHQFSFENFCCRPGVITFGLSHVCTILVASCFIHILLGLAVEPLWWHRI